MVRNLLVAAAVTFLCSGCLDDPVKNPPNVGGASSVATWTGSNATPPGSVYRLGNLFAVWGDFREGASGSVSSNAEFVECKGWLKSNGAQVPFSCVSTDGRFGQVTIGDQTFDLARGRLFLVTDVETIPRVKQLQRDLDAIVFRPEPLQTLVQNDPEIRSFFSATDEGSEPADDQPPAPETPAESSAEREPSEP